MQNLDSRDRGDDLTEPEDTIKAEAPKFSSCRNRVGSPETEKQPENLVENPCRNDNVKSTDKARSRITVAAETKIAKGMNRAERGVSVTSPIPPTLGPSTKHSLRSLVVRIPWKWIASARTMTVQSNTVTVQQAVMMSELQPLGERERRAYEKYRS
jgi:hypothetical protein